MRARLVVLVDTASPLAEVDRTLADWGRWLAELGWAERLVSASLVVGSRASWVPEGTSLAGSAVVRGVGRGERVALGEALERVGAPTALLTVLTLMPGPGWEQAPIAAPLRCVVTTTAVPLAAAGQGRLGTPFGWDHRALALRWLTCETLDRTWVCECGALQLYRGPSPGSCASCGDPLVLPPRLRIGGRIVLVQPGARLFPHHLGRPLAFDAPVLEIGAELPTGDLVIDGVRGRVRADAGPVPRVSGRFRALPLRASVTRCHACGDDVGSAGLSIPPDPRRFCGRCVQTEDRCDFCAVPLGAGGGSAWPDGRTACRDCWSTSVTELADLEDLADRARRWLARRLSIEVPPCPLHFEHAAAIAAMHGRVFRPQRGFTAREAGFFRTSAGGSEVFCEHGSPRNFTYGVLVHELTHQWQFGAWSLPVPLVLVEGLATWTEYHALLEAGAIHEARRIEVLRDPVYGAGFRVALAVEKERGFDAVKSALPTLRPG